jgi:hypothetical protein
MDIPFCLDFFKDLEGRIVILLTDQRGNPDHCKIFSLQWIPFCIKQSSCFFNYDRKIPVRDGLVEINPVVNDLRKRGIAFGCPDIVPDKVKISGRHVRRCFFGKGMKGREPGVDDFTIIL